MESEINKAYPYLNSSILNAFWGLRFIIIALLMAIILQIYHQPFTQNNLFSWGVYGWMIDMLMPLCNLVILTGLLIKANWARLALLFVCWSSISLTLVSLLTAIGFYDVSSLNLWHYLALTLFFLGNTWAILYLTRADVLSYFKVKAQRV